MALSPSIEILNNEPTPAGFSTDLLALTTHPDTGVLEVFPVIANGVDSNAGHVTDDLSSLAVRETNIFWSALASAPETDFPQDVRSTDYMFISRADVERGVLATHGGVFAYDESFEEQVREVIINLGREGFAVLDKARERWIEDWSEAVLLPSDFCVVESVVIPAGAVDIARALVESDK